MAVLTTTTGQHVFTNDEPYLVRRLNKRYYLIAERVTESDTIRICVYDAVADIELVTPRIVPADEASTIWQTWYRALSM